MMLLPVYPFFAYASGPAEGLTLSEIEITIIRVKKSDKSVTTVVSSQPAQAEIGDGYYVYFYDAADLSIYDYLPFINYTGSEPVAPKFYAGDRLTATPLSSGVPEYASLRDELRAYLQDSEAQAQWSNDELDLCIYDADLEFSKVCPLKQRSILSIQKEVHKVEDTTQVITSPDAADQSSVNTLLNEIKADYNTHRASTTYHRAADSTNVVSSDNASDLASSLTLAIEIMADLSAHMIQSGVHMVDDIANAITCPTPVDLITVIIASNHCKSKYTEHLSHETDGREVYIYPVISDSDFLRLESVEYPVGLYPKQSPLFDYMGSGNFLTLLTDYKPSVSGELVYVFWQKIHAADEIPNEHKSVLRLGAQGFALLMRATERRHQAVVDIASARTEIAKLIAGGATDAAAVKTILDNVGTHVGQATTAFGKIDTYLAGNTAPSTKKYLEDGDDKIIGATPGKDVAATYGQFGEISARMAAGFNDEGNSHISQATAYINEAIQLLGILGLYSNEAYGHRDSAVQEMTDAEGFWNHGQRCLSRFYDGLKDIDTEQRHKEKPQNIMSNIWLPD